MRPREEHPRCKQGLRDSGFSSQAVPNRSILPCGQAVCPGTALNPSPVCVSSELAAQRQLERNLREMATAGARRATVSAAEQLSATVQTEPCVWAGRAAAPARCPPLSPSHRAASTAIRMPCSVTAGSQNWQRNKSEIRTKVRLEVTQLQRADEGSVPREPPMRRGCCPCLALLAGLGTAGGGRVLGTAAAGAQTPRGCCTKACSEQHL